MASKNRLVQYHQWDEMKHPSQMIIFHSIVLKDIELLSLRNQTYLKLPSEEVSLQIFKGENFRRLPYTQNQHRSCHQCTTEGLSILGHCGKVVASTKPQGWDRGDAFGMDGNRFNLGGPAISHLPCWIFLNKSCGVPKFLETFPCAHRISKYIGSSWHRITTWPCKRTECSSISSIKPELTTWTTHPSRQESYFFYSMSQNSKLYLFMFISFTQHPLNQHSPPSPTFPGQRDVETTPPLWPGERLSDGPVVMLQPPPNWRQEVGLKQSSWVKYLVLFIIGHFA